MSKCALTRPLDRSDMGISSYEDSVLTIVLGGRRILILTETLLIADIRQPHKLVPVLFKCSDDPVCRLDGS